jgi:saccharopine dehydrogenase-like NADP-dependent oxidoreductase
MTAREQYDKIHEATRFKTKAATIKELMILSISAQILDLEELRKFTEVLSDVDRAIIMKLNRLRELKREAEAL